MTDRIVVLDGHTLVPDPTGAHELNWSDVQALGDVTVHERSASGEIIERLRGATVLLTNKVMISRQVLEALPELKYVGVTATGTNCVDLAAAKERGVIVTNVPGYGAASVAQHVFALLLELTNRVAAHDGAVRPRPGEPGWVGAKDWSFTVGPIVELADKTLGIVGLGAIGQRVAQIGAALGMHIAAAYQNSMKEVRLEGLEIEWLAVDELFAKSDVLTLHCPLTDETNHLVNAIRLAMMKSGAFLINTGRGGLIDESALANALRDGRIAGAGLDVLSTEPPAFDNPLLSAPRCLITPHVAWASLEARRRLLSIAAENIRAYQLGQPVNVVNA
ncbi:MAG: D-2-hydroxyacid dehydrogenase [Phycisphaeraceae bacterium]